MCPCWTLFPSPLQPRAARPPPGCTRPWCWSPSSPSPPGRPLPPSSWRSSLPLPHKTRPREPSSTVRRRRRRWKTMLLPRPTRRLTRASTPPRQPPSPLTARQAPATSSPLRRPPRVPTPPTPLPWACPTRQRSPTPPPTGPLSPSPRRTQSLEHL